MAGIGIPSPLRTFGLPSMRCGAARRTGLSLQLQYLQEVDSHNADQTDLRGKWTNVRFSEPFQKGLPFFELTSLEKA